jgi:hypothetical protein
VSATGGILRSVIHESGDVGAEELNTWIKKLDGRESALLMKSGRRSFDRSAVLPSTYDFQKAFSCAMITSGASTV